MLQKLITNVYMQFLINILLKFKISDKWYSFQFNGSEDKKAKKYRKLEFMLIKLSSFHHGAYIFLILFSQS